MLGFRSISYLAGATTLFMLALGAHSSAATVGSVHGTIRDSTDRQPISEADVTLESTSMTYRTVTDARGFFSFVGLRPDTYSLIVTKSGYATPVPTVLAVTQDSSRELNIVIARGLQTIATVTARAASFAVQPHQPNDVYVVGAIEQAQLGGVPAFENEGLLLNSMPGVSAVGGGTGGYTGSGTSIRGGLANDTGYQLDGVNATDPITNYFINNLILNGSQNLQLTAGPGDASKGGSGSGYVNIVSKVGTYPASGYVQFEDGGPAYEHNIEFEYGRATSDQRSSLFVSGRYGREFGGCCAPPYGNTYGSQNSSYPDTFGQVQFEATNDTLANYILHFGRNHENALQLWAEIGANSIVGGSGLDPATYPFPSNSPAYLSIYSQAPVLLSLQTGAPMQPPLSTAQTQALVPFFPGQISATQTIGVAPSETTQYDLFKIAFSRRVSSRSYINARLYRTQNSVVDSFNDPNNVVFGYGLPTLGFSDVYAGRATQSTGFATDLQQFAGQHHNITFGFDYRFSRASLDGFLPSSTLFFAGPTIGDFLPQGYVNPLTGAPGLFAGQRYPTFNETIVDPMHRTAFYINDDWNASDRLVLQPGLRYDLQTVPTAAGKYEANSLQPRLFGVLTLGTHRDTVIRAGYGHATTFAPLFQIENLYNPPPSFHAFPATLPICGGVAANFSAPCKDYYDELYNAWWKGYGVNPYAFPLPQQSDTFDFSIERAFDSDIGVKLTFFTRRDYNVIVNSQQVTISQGAVIPGTTVVNNDGRAQTAGVEAQITRQIRHGLSVQFNATYINQFVNYVTSSAFRPSVQPALLASGALFHPSYLSPFTATASLDYQKGGWRIDPIVQYIRGYPIGIWSNAPAFINGAPVFIPNTNLFGNFGSQFCYYVDPQTPGTPTNPNISGSTGGGCTPAFNGSLTHPVMYANIAISREISPHLILGLEVQNIFNNYANYPYYNPGYINNGFGVYGPGSGTNPVPLPGLVASYPSGPFFAYPSGHGRQFTVYTRINL